jgi:hypothetical protein
MRHIANVVQFSEGKFKTLLRATSEKADQRIWDFKTFGNTLWFTGLVSTFLSHSWQVDQIREMSAGFLAADTSYQCEKDLVSCKRTSKFEIPC